MNLNDVDKKLLLLPERFHEKFPLVYDELYRAGIFPRRIEDVKDETPQAVLDDTWATRELWVLSRTFERTVKEAIGKNWDAFCWIEDDVVFCEDFDFYKRLDFPEGYDAIYFGTTIASQASRINEHFAYADWMHGTHFVVFLKSGFKSLLKYFSEPNNAIHAVDNTINMSRIRKCTIHPNPTWQRKKPWESDEQAHYNQQTGDYSVNPHFRSEL